MKNSSWYLWLNGQKVYNIRQLRENFDTALLTGYFLGGSLMKWLSDIGEADILKRLSCIDTSGNVGEQLEFAFGVVPDKNPEPTAPVVTITAEITDTAPNSGTLEIPIYTGSFYGTVSSYYGLAESLSDTVSSFAAIVGNAVASQVRSSFTGFDTSSYSAFVTGQALNISSSFSFGSGSSFSALFAENLFKFGIVGSFTGSSFSFGSFGYLFGKYSQFTAGSFTLGGSYAFGSFLLSMFRYMRLSGSFGSFGSFGNIDMFFGEGSFRYSAAGITITAEEYHRTLINLSSCPLNAYGYGINLI